VVLPQTPKTLGHPLSKPVVPLISICKSVLKPLTDSRADVFCWCFKVLVPSSIINRSRSPLLSRTASRVVRAFRPSRDASLKMVALPLRPPSITSCDPLSDYCRIPGHRSAPSRRPALSGAYSQVFESPKRSTDFSLVTSMPSRGLSIVERHLPQLAPIASQSPILQARGAAHRRAAGPTASQMPALRPLAGLHRRR
jgi:hypothetical protein